MKKIIYLIITPIMLTACAGKSSFMTDLSSFDMKKRSVDSLSAQVISRFISKIPADSLYSLLKRRQPKDSYDFEFLLQVKNPGFTIIPVPGFFLVKKDTPSAEYTFEMNPFDISGFIQYGDHPFAEISCNKVDGTNEYSLDFIQGVMKNDWLFYSNKKKDGYSPFSCALKLTDKYGHNIRLFLPYRFFINDKEDIIAYPVFKPDLVLSMEEVIEKHRKSIR